MEKLRRKMGEGNECSAGIRNKLGEGRQTTMNKLMLFPPIELIWVNLMFNAFNVKS